MHQRRRIRSFVAVGLGLGLAFGLTGCGKAAEKLSEKAAEKAIENAAGGNAKVDIDDGTVKIETDDGSFHAGGGEIPADWPSDIPLPGSYEVMNVVTSSADGGTNISFTLSVDMTVAEAAALYEDGLPGWETEGTTSMSSDGLDHRMMMFKKGEDEASEILNIGVSDIADEGATAMVFTYAKE